MDLHITVPFDESTAKSLKSGDYVYLSGIIYTARDAAHKRLVELIEKNSFESCLYLTTVIFENESTQNSIPCGFLGYPVRQYPTGYDTIQISYNTELSDALKNKGNHKVWNILGIKFNISLAQSEY